MVSVLMGVNGCLWHSMLVPVQIFNDLIGKTNAPLSIRGGRLIPI